MLHFSIVDGPQAMAHLTTIARIQSSVFREFPYLYHATPEYARGYLSTYFQAPRARMILCRDGEDIVGVSTVIPLEDEVDEIKGPVELAGLTPSEFAYFGESMVLRPYRGRGIGSRFFVERLGYARSIPGVTKAVFCEVMRAENDARRPSDYTKPEPLWRKYGFEPLSGVTCRLVWKTVDELVDRPHDLQFWIRRGLDSVEAIAMDAEPIQ